MDEQFVLYKTNVMISEQTRNYGAVISSLIDAAQREIKIRKLYPDAPGVYLVDGHISLYAKYSSNRRGPWGFTFQAQHIDRLEELIGKFGACVVALVCGTDGIVALRYDEFSRIVSIGSSGQKSIGVKRKLNRMYSVTGTSGSLSHKISRNSLLEAVQSYENRKEV